jgi:hypothetical protein
MLLRQALLASRKSLVQLTAGELCVQPLMCQAKRNSAFTTGVLQHAAAAGCLS